MTPVPSLPKDIAKAVAIAGLSALATGLVNWGLEELKRRVGATATKKKESG